MNYSDEDDEYYQERLSYEEEDEYDEDEYDEDVEDVEGLSYEDIENLRKGGLIEFGDIPLKFFDDKIKDADEANLHKLDKYFKGEEIQLNICLRPRVSIDEDYFDNNVKDEQNKFIPNFVFLRDLILNSTIHVFYKDKHYVQYNNYIFIIKIKKNKCEIVNYDNCEDIYYENGKKKIIRNPPQRHNVEWTTYYLVKVFKDNSRYHKILKRFVEFIIPLPNYIDCNKFIKNNITKQHNYSMLLILSEMDDFLILKQILKSKEISIKRLYNIPEVLFVEIINFIF